MKISKIVLQLPKSKRHTKKTNDNDFLERQNTRAV
jgi:hypothetical protein